MQTLLLKFGVRLEDLDIPDASKHAGPLFHRWLPNGAIDAIAVETGDPNAKLEFWFERWGFVNETADGTKDFILFNYLRKEVDPERMTWQAILDAGPLMGMLTLLDLSEEETLAVSESRVGDSAYVKLGKRVVKLIFSPLSKVIHVLRDSYGQYWLKSLPKWDSRCESLGYYCSIVLGLVYSLDGGHTWKRFQPDKSEQRIAVNHRKISLDEYLQERDWQELGRIVSAAVEPTLASDTLTRAHRALDSGNLQYALIEGITALEMAISEYMTRHFKGRKVLDASLSPFWNLPLRTQLASVAAASGRITPQDCELAIMAIELRNRIIHEGEYPASDAFDTVHTLLRVVASLLLGPHRRFPSARPLNELHPPETQ